MAFAAAEENSPKAFWFEGVWATDYVPRNLACAAGDFKIFIISMAPYWVSVPRFLELLTMDMIAVAASLVKLPIGLCIATTGVPES